MQAQEFCHWLKNYFSIYDPYALTQTQLIEEIKEKLNEVPNVSEEYWGGNPEYKTYDNNPLGCSGVRYFSFAEQAKLGLIKGSG